MQHEEDFTPPAKIKARSHDILPLPYINYAYGLAVPNVTLQAHGDQFQIGVMLQNVAEGPLLAAFEQPAMSIVGCIRADKEEKIKPILLHRTLSNVMWCPLMKRLAVKPTPRIDGMLGIECVYGHPDGLPVRRMKAELSVTLIFAQQPIVQALIKHQEDTPILEPID